LSALPGEFRQSGVVAQALDHPGQLGAAVVGGDADPHQPAAAGHAGKSARISRLNSSQFIRTSILMASVHFYVVLPLPLV